jgi:hypothetical protein
VPRLPPRCAVNQTRATQRHSRSGVNRKRPRFNITPHYANSSHSLRSCLSSFGGSTSHNGALCRTPLHVCHTSWCDERMVSFGRCAQVWRTQLQQLSQGYSTRSCVTCGRASPLVRAIHNPNVNNNPNRSLHAVQGIHPPCTALAMRVFFLTVKGALRRYAPLTGLRSGRLGRKTAAKRMLHGERLRASYAQKTAAIGVTSLLLPSQL